MRQYKEFLRESKLDESVSRKVLFEFGKKITELNNIVKDIAEDRDSKQKDMGYNSEIHRVKSKLQDKLTEATDLFEKLVDQSEK